MSDLRAALRSFDGASRSADMTKRGLVLVNASLVGFVVRLTGSASAALEAAHRLERDAWVPDLIRALEAIVAEENADTQRPSAAGGERQ